jgi:hypothetical protein
MKELIEIYLHSAGVRDEKIIQIVEDATVNDLLLAAREVGLAHESDVILLIEDGEEPLERHARLCDHGVKHKHHLHCHQCRRVDVKVHFNGQEREAAFSPSKKVKGVLKWAVKAFELHGVDAENKELRLGSAAGSILESQQHIGSWTSPGSCCIELYLTAIVEVQG